MDWLALAARAKVARLGTVNADGGVDLVPITFAFRGDDRMVTAVDHKPKSTQRLRRLANIDRHPGVTVLIDHYDDDWDELWWVRVRGQARVVQPGDPDGDHTGAVDALVARYPQYRDRRPAGPAIVIERLEWRGWAATRR